VVPVARAIPSGIPELVHHRETGLLVTEHPDQAAAAIGALARDPLLWNHCSSQARDLVKQTFHEDLCCENWYALLNQLCQRSTVQYPISGLDGVKLSKLSPFVQGSHYQEHFWRSRKLRQRFDTTLAILKGRMKTVLTPFR
jgi:colanic acid/amylovoran biosynthesis glycosyltransferase